MGVRWILARAGQEDKIIFEGEGIALAGYPPAFEMQPTIILSMGEQRAYLIGEATLEALLDAVSAAYAEVEREKAKAT